MTAKKRWLNKIYHESQEQLNTQVDISWSSSESEDCMDECIHIKKRKRIDKVVEKWIKSNDVEEENVTSNNFAKIDLPSTSSCYFQSIGNCDYKKDGSFPAPKHNSGIIKQREDSIEKYGISLYPSPYTANFRIESPIINSLKLEELSPVLVQNSGNDTTDQISPVIGERCILKKVRSKYKKQHKVKQQVFKSSSCSPDLFVSQPTQVIESNSPDLFNKNDTSIKINESQSTECIDPFPSQYSSQINSDSDNSLIRTDSSSLYHLPPPRKKCFKKGGVALLLQKALHIQRARVSIWQHEIYTKKTDTIIGFSENDIIKFTIKEKWKEYGSTLLKCEVCNVLQSKESDSDLFCSTENNSFFIIIIGFSTTLNIVFTTKCKYKLFPPYRVKHIFYECEKVPCYFNVTKISNSKE